MSNITPVYAMIFSLVIILIVLDAVLKDNVFLTKAREWQTLIGATIGFIAISYALILEGRISAEKEYRKQVSGEINILQSASIDIEAAMKSIKALHDPLPTGDITDPNICANSITILRTHPIRDIAISRRMDQIASNVSAFTYSTLVAPISTLELYKTSLRSLGVNDCMVNPSGVAEFFSNIAASTLDELGKMKTKMNDLIVTLSRI